MAEIIVIGGGGHAKVVVSILKKTLFSILGYTDRQNRGELLQIPYLGDDGILQSYISRYPGCQAVIAVGKVNTSAIRLRLQREISRMGFAFPAVVSPTAVRNEAVEIGAGTCVFDRVVINSGSTIGLAGILNTGSVVDHDCRIGDNVHIAPGATLSGGVSIGSNCMIGAGATVIQNVSICGDCLIGAGSTVIRDISSPGTYVGTPAKKIH